MASLYDRGDVAQGCPYSGRAESYKSLSCQFSQSLKVMIVHLPHGNAPHRESKPKHRVREDRRRFRIRVTHILRRRGGNPTPSARAPHATYEGKRGRNRTQQQKWSRAILTCSRRLENEKRKPRAQKQPSCPRVQAKEILCFHCNILRQEKQRRGTEICKLFTDRPRDTGVTIRRSKKQSSIHRL